MAIFAKNSLTQVSGFDNPIIAIYPDNITSMSEIVPLMEMCFAEKKPLVVMCDSLQGEALMFIVANVAQKKLPVCFINCPGFGEMKKDILLDIESLILSMLCSL